MYTGVPRSLIYHRSSFFVTVLPLPPSVDLTPVSALLSLDPRTGRGASPRQGPRRWSSAGRESPPRTSFRHTGGLLRALAPRRPSRGCSTSGRPGAQALDRVLEVECTGQ